MKNPTITLTYLGLLFFCIGCNPPAPTVSDSGLETQSLTKLVSMAMNESEEIKFCLDDDAGIELLRGPGERLQEVAQALPDAVSKSALADAKKDKANKSIGALTQACDSLVSSIKNQASSKEISKANSKIHIEILELTKLSR